MRIVAASVLVVAFAPPANAVNLCSFVAPYVSNAPNQFIADRAEAINSRLWKSASNPGCFVSQHGGNDVRYRFFCKNKSYSDLGAAKNFFEDEKAELTSCIGSAGGFGGPEFTNDDDNISASQAFIWTRTSPKGNYEIQWSLDLDKDSNLYSSTLSVSFSSSN